MPKKPSTTDGIAEMNSIYGLMKRCSLTGGDFAHINGGRDPERHGEGECH